MKNLMRTVGATLAAAMLTLAGATAASAQTVKPHSTKSPNIVIGCGLGVSEPFYVSGTSWLYGQAGTSGCTNPPPETCNITVELQYWDPNYYLGAQWVSGSASSTGYKSCVGLTATTRYSCIQVDNRKWRVWTEMSEQSTQGTAYTQNYSLYQYHWC